MKNLIFILIAVVLSSISYGQTTKADSIKQVEQQKIVTEIVTKTPIATFQEWLYKNMTAEKYNEFVQFYNEYIRQQYAERIKLKKAN